MVRSKAWVQKYLGSDKPLKGLKTAEVMAQAKKKVQATPADQLLPLIDQLYSQGRYFEDLQLAGCILNRKPKWKTQVAPTKLNTWLNYTHGWAETDILCQNGWDTNVMLSDWPKWEKLLTRFAQDKNIHKRRASLVILVMPTRKSADPRLSQTAFQNIELLKAEKEVLITKAISWLLRALIVHHRQEVDTYLTNNQDTLPKIAIRETTNKLKTGKK